MIMLSIISLLVGAVLAQRFKIMVLIPAAGIMLGAGAVFAYSGWWTILVIAAAGASMQVGYIIGLVIRRVLEAPGESVQPFRPNTSAR